MVGLPEAAINLAQAVTYLSCAPKSNASYKGLREAQALVKKTGALPVPKSLRSSSTSWSKSQGYGKGYKYSHDSQKGYVRQHFLPEAVQDQRLYKPSTRGFEKKILEYQSWVGADKDEGKVDEDKLR
jgi:putative ATPase